MSRRCAGERGALSVETALVLPVLLVLVGGTLVLGLHVWWSALVDNAAQAGLRSAQMRESTGRYPNDAPYLPGTSGYRNAARVHTAVGERMPGATTVVACGTASAPPVGATTCVRLQGLPGTDMRTGGLRHKVQGDQVTVTVVHRVEAVHAATRLIPVPALANALSSKLGTITGTARGRLE